MDDDITRTEAERRGVEGFKTPRDAGSRRTAVR